MWPVGFDEVEFREAVDWFLGRTLVTRSEWDAMAEASRRKAFMVSGVAQLDVISDIWKALDHAIAEGRTLADFKADIGAKLQTAWAGSVNDPATRLETIFRTNLQVSYSAGRYSQLTQPDALESRPYWMYNAIFDDRTTPVCKACDGKILPADHAFWRDHIPPLHFNCRSALLALSEEDAHARGIATAPPNETAEDGFGKAPGNDDWAPDPADYPPELWKVYAGKQAVAEEAEATHDPAHWLPEYERFGDAAPALAWGRASEERGLDSSLPKVRGLLQSLRTPVVDNALGILDIAATAGVQHETLRDTLKWAIDNGASEDVRAALRIAGLFAGHRSAIVSVGELAAKVSFPRKEPLRAMAKKQYADATAFLGNMVAKGVATGPVSIGFSERRGFFDPVKRKISSSYRGHVLEHEWGHALEELNPELAKRAAKFLDARTQGEPAQRLRDVTKNPAYASHEVTRPDKFRNPYVGKVYKNHRGETTATEVTSMGVEWLSSEEAALALRADPEHVYFTLGQLAGTR